MYTINFQADYEVYKALQNNMDCVAAKLSELKNEAQQFPKESMARQVRSFSLHLSFITKV